MKPLHLYSIEELKSPFGITVTRPHAELAEMIKAMGHEIRDIYPAYRAKSSTPWVIEANGDTEREAVEKVVAEIIK